MQPGANDQITPFNFNGNNVRTIADDQGEPWFVLKDVCDVLEITNPRNAAARIASSDKGVRAMDTPGGTQNITIVNESGLYDVILDSRKPQAREFRRWVTAEVIPSIRKHGGYLTERKIEEVLADPDTIIKLATDLKEERARRAELETQRKIDAPKVLFADAVATSKSDILVGDLAKILKGLSLIHI